MEPRDKVEKKESSLIKAWWRIDRGNGKVGRVYKEKLRILVGRGDRTSFWTD